MAGCKVRLLTHADIAEVTDFVVTEFCPELSTPCHYAAHRQRVFDIVSRYVGPSTVGFVAERDGRIIGALLARIGHPPMSFDLAAFEDYFYVRPSERGKFVFVRLMNTFLTWAADSGALGVHMTVESGISPERTDKLLALFGFKPAGVKYQRPLQ